MSKVNIAIIIGTTRDGRFADKPAQWIYKIAQTIEGLDCELLDLRDYPMPFFDEMASNAFVPSKNEVAIAWQKKLDEFDGYLFITGEYNHSIPGVLKNALDYASPEWNRKPAAFLGYGMVGAARAIQQLKEICVELQMSPLKYAVHIQGGDFRKVLFEGLPLEDLEYLVPVARSMFEQLIWWASVLKAGREGVSNEKE